MEFSYFDFIYLFYRQRFLATGSRQQTEREVPGVASSPSGEVLKL
jgi:hypothetical protein